MKRTIALFGIAVVFAGAFVLGLVSNKQRVLGVVPNAQGKHDHECSNATWIGEYVYYGHGNQMVDGVNQPIVLIGHLTADGNGGFVGRGTTALNGVTTRRTFTATYTIEPNCHGTYDGVTDTGVRFYGDTEIHSDGEEGVSIRGVPGQRSSFPTRGANHLTTTMRTSGSVAVVGAVRSRRDRQCGRAVVWGLGGLLPKRLFLMSPVPDVDWDPLTRPDKSGHPLSQGSEGPDS